jgi:hypothetical protein
MEMRRIARVLAVALAAMALPPVTASAKPGYYRVAPSHTIQLLPARGTHGYRVDIAVIEGRPELLAVRQSGAGVSFVSYRQIKQRDTGDNLDADFGKAGRIKARFVPEKVQEQKAPKGCVGGPTVAAIGYFVGPLSFHGANGFISFKVHRLRGGVTHSRGLVCRRRPKFGPDSFEREDVLRVIAGVPSGNTFFGAATELAEDNIPSNSTYIASSRHTDGTVDIL